MPSTRKIMLALTLKVLGLLSSGLGIASLFFTSNLLPAIILTILGATLIIGGVFITRRAEVH